MKLLRQLNGGKNIPVIAVKIKTCNRRLVVFPFFIEWFVGIQFVTVYINENSFLKISCTGHDFLKPLNSYSFCTYIIKKIESD